MLIFDAHLDLGLNAIDWNRDLRMTVAEIRAAEQSLGMTEPGRGTNTVSFPELRRAEVGVGIATVLARIETPINHPFGYTTPEACYAVAMAHLAYYRAMERAGAMTMIRTREELNDHAAACAADPSRTPFGFILSMECGDPVLDPDQIFEWHELGLRAVGITHYGPNRYGGGTRSEAGLAAEALPLLKNIESLGIALDLTHLSDRSFRQVADRFGGRVLASHQNARKFCDWQRQFSDDQIRHVIGRDGVLGIAFDAVMLQPGWVRGQSRPEVTIERAVDNIDHICQLAGDARHAGIGSDLDGGYGKEQTPADLDTIADLQMIPDLLAKRGYTDGDIRAVMHGNFLRFFAEVLPSGAPADHKTARQAHAPRPITRPRPANG
jgi:membrane dipeptidase